MVARGFISHRHRPTYYSPSSRTALAEAELEYADLKSTSVYVAFPVSEGGMSEGVREAVTRARAANPDAGGLHIAIWTTTPWSLPGNMVSTRTWVQRLIAGRVGSR
jgi:isoleucyl-tRNA synthetase